MFVRLEDKPRAGVLYTKNLPGWNCRGVTNGEIVGGVSFSRASGLEYAKAGSVEMARYTHFLNPRVMRPSNRMEYYLSTAGKEISGRALHMEIVATAETYLDRVEAERPAAH